MAPTFGTAEIAFNRMRVQVTDKRFFKVNESKMVLTLPHGSKIHFKSAEKADNLYGDDVYAFVFDEFTRARESAWHALRTTITSTGGKGKFIGNVRGRRNWGHIMAMKAKAGLPGYAYFKITAYDAAAEGMLTKDGRPMADEIAEAKMDLPESVFNELYLAEASEDGSNPFGIQFIQQCVYPLSTKPPICFGIDLAKSVDWTAIIGLDVNACVSYFDHFRKDWTSTTNDIIALPEAPAKIDSTGVGDPIVETVQTKRQRAEGFKFTQYSKQQIMEGLALAIQKRAISFPDGPIKDELESFEFEYTRTGVLYTAPAGMHDDCVCALAMAWDLHKVTSKTGNYAWA